MALSLHFQQLFHSPTTFPSQPKPPTTLLTTLKLPPTPSLPLLAIAQNASLSNIDKVVLPLQLKREMMPKHVAVIMDGNRRWAKMRGFPVALGYEAGIRAVRKLIELCGNWGIGVLTLFAFSSDNWLRPKVTSYEFLLFTFRRNT
ncbi:Isoprenyl transferase 1 [Capsicum annuum]|uniref:Isoprenyl transferase 1 n=1 Tax=Capsicum annuum TaxID=4072 RepID=A0A2G2YD34_CAPAN|nr:Isoprenyl transferase 1 [Capsicum annuum]